MSQKIMGIDVGTVRVGIAMSDAAIGIAHPRETLAAADAVEEVVVLVDAESVTTIVIGWPLHLDGSEGLATRRVEKFEARLVEALGGREIELIRWDERLTTTAAENFLIGADVSRSRRKEVVDQIAATHILQGWLDSRET